MSQKAMEVDSEEEHLLPHPQQTAPQYEHDQFYPISHPPPPPPHYGHSSAQVSGNAFIGPYQGVANTGVPQYPPPYPHGGANQMQQQVVVVGQHPQHPQTFIAIRPPNAYTWHIVLSCIVFWCCGWLCGAIAFALAVHARSTLASGDLTGARRLGHLSLVVSVVGIVVGVAALSVVMALTMSGGGQQ